MCAHIYNNTCFYKITHAMHLTMLCVILHEQMSMDGVTICVWVFYSKGNSTNTQIIKMAKLICASMAKYT